VKYSILVKFRPFLCNIYLAQNWSLSQFGSLIDIVISTVPFNIKNTLHLGYILTGLASLGVNLATWPISFSALQSVFFNFIHTKSSVLSQTNKKSVKNIYLQRWKGTLRSSDSISIKGCVLTLYWCFYYLLILMSGLIDSNPVSFAIRILRRIIFFWKV